MSRRLVRIATTLVALALLGAGCGGDSDEASPTDHERGCDLDDPRPDEAARGGSHESLRDGRHVLRGRRPSDVDEEAPRATDDGITADAISVTHIRVTLEDLEGIGFAIPIGDPADQAEKFVGLINDRCGGIHGRKLDLHLVEAPPLAGEGQDPAAIAQAACIKATEDNKSVFAFSGSGWGGQGGASCVTSAHDTIYITTYTITPEDLADADNRLYSTALSPADGLKYAAKVLKADGAFDGKKIGVVMADCAGRARDRRERTARHAEGARRRADARRRDRLQRRQQLHAGRHRVGAGHDHRRRRRDVPAAERHQPAGLPLGDGHPGREAGRHPVLQHRLQRAVGRSRVEQGRRRSAARKPARSTTTRRSSAPAATGAFRLPDFEPGAVRRDVQPRVPGGGRRRSTPPTIPKTNSAYGATTGSCAFVRIIARAIDAAGPNPTRKDLAAAVENLGALDGGGVPGSFEPGKYTAPNALYKLRWHYPCPRRTCSRSTACASCPKARRSRSRTDGRPPTDAARRRRRRSGSGRAGRARGRGADRGSEAARRSRPRARR